jgi:ATP dependent DNA ligase domain
MKSVIRAAARDPTEVAPGIVRGLVVELLRLRGVPSQVHINKGRIRIFTRKGLDWTKRFSAIAEAFDGIPVERAIIDGEIVVIENERTDFGALQAETWPPASRAGCCSTRSTCSTWKGSIYDARH